MDGQSLNIIQRNLLPFSMAISAIVGGGLFTATDSTGHKVFGTVLAALGGALLARSLEDPDAEKTKILARETELLTTQKARLAPINRHLASVTKEVLSVVRKPPQNRYAAEESLRLVHQQVQNMIGVMTDIADVAGEQFDPNTIFQTASQVEELADLLDSLSRRTKSRKERETIERVQSTLAKIHPDVYRRVAEQVDCPFCNERMSVEVGLAAPASASPTCLSCKRGFHVHRKHNGSVETNQPFSATTAYGRQNEVVGISCSCGESFSASIQKGRAETRVCNECGAVINIGANGVVEVRDEKRVSSYSITEVSTRPNGKLICPEHDVPLAVRRSDASVTVAYCRSGPHLLRIEANGKTKEIDERGNANGSDGADDF